MTTQRSPHRSRHWRATWQAAARPGRLATILAAVISGLMASVAAATAAFAGMNPIPVPGGDPGAYIGDPYIGTMGTGPVAPVPATTVHVISTGGMAGWQITLIALGAALIAATAAVLLDRARAARRPTPATLT